MIKIGEIRYHPDEIKKYYPLFDPSGFACIVFHYRTYDSHGHNTETIKFESLEARDKTLNAMDEMLLIIDDGVIIAREMPDLPFIVGGGGFDPPGGINLQ